MSTTSKSRKNFKLKNVSFISSLSLNNPNLFNFLPPKRINTSTSRSSNTNRASSRHKRNSSRDMQSDKRSTHFKNDCSYSNVNTTNYIKTSCYLKSLNNYNFNNKSNNLYHIYNTTRGLSASTSYRNATPQNQTHRQLTRSTSTAQQLLNKRNVSKYMQSSKQHEYGINNIKVLNCVIKDNSQPETQRMNTQSSCYSGTCTFNNTVKCKKNSITKTKESSSSQNSNTNTASSKGSKQITRGDGYKGKIETPEDLHFFYVHVIQNGKQYEHKF